MAACLIKRSINPSSGLCNFFYVSSIPGTYALNKRTLHSTIPKYQNDEQRTNQFALSFDEYQNLKRSFKTKQRIAGVPFAFLGMTAASFTTAYLYPDMFDATPENVQLIMGIDPLVFSGISGVAAAGVGYILGTNFYKFLWKTFNKTEHHNLYERDADFLKRLDKYRFGQDSKFEDDYYGESIKTLSDYRQWVRTHQRKRKNHEKYTLKVSSETKETT